MTSKSDLNRFPERSGMKAALDAATRRKGKPDESDRSPPSTFPMTPAAHEALRHSKGLYPTGPQE